MALDDGELSPSFMHRSFALKLVRSDEKVATDSRLGALGERRSAEACKEEVESCGSGGSDGE